MITLMCVCVCVSELSVAETVSLSPTSYLGLLDRTRMFLCLFMMTLFMLNPFAGIVKLGREFPTSSVDSGGRTAARTLLAAESTETGTSATPVIGISLVLFSSTSKIIFKSKIN